MERTSTPTIAQRIAEREIERNIAKVMAQRNARYIHLWLGDLSANVIASGRNIVSTTPYSIGWVDVPLGRANPLRTIRPSVTTPVSPGMWIRSMNSCLVAYWIKPKVATRPAAKTNRPNSTLFRLDWGCRRLRRAVFPPFRAV